LLNEKESATMYIKKKIKEFLMSNEVVKYHNDLNTIIMRKWSPEEMNFFFTIIAKVREQGTKLMKFNSDELRELASNDLHLDRWAQTMKSVATKVVDLKYYERTDCSFAIMNLFSYFRVEESEKSVEIEVSSKFEYILNKLEAQFTMYELKEFTRIKSTYAKTMYRLLKQWRMVGKREFSLEEFKTLLDTPKAYKTSEIDRAVVKPILKELTPFFKDLKVKKVKAKTKGTPVKSYIFTWTTERKEAEVIVPVEVPEFTSLEAFFATIEGISVDSQKAITDISSNFEPAEALSMLSFAESLRKQKAKSAIAYTIKVIKEWAENNVKTLEQAKKFYEANYSQKAEPQAKKTKKKGGKKQAKASGESNVPYWSKPDYKNKLDPNYLKELEEAQIALGIYGTPQAVKELEDARKEVEAERAKLEEQTKGLQERLGNL
jgi:replication protein